MSLDTALGSLGRRGERRQKLDQLKVLECCGNGMDGVLSTYKRGYWAENAKSGLAESGSVAMSEWEIGMECSLVEWSSEGWTCMAPGRNICPAGYFS